MTIKIVTIRYKNNQSENQVSYMNSYAKIENTTEEWELTTYS